MRSHEENIIALLVEQAGGEVSLPRAAFYRAGELELATWEDEVRNQIRITATRPPVTLEGEIVPESEPCYARHELAPGISQGVPHIHPTAP